MAALQVRGGLIVGSITLYTTTRPLPNNELRARYCYTVPSRDSHDISRWLELTLANPLALLDTAHPTGWVRMPDGAWCSIVPITGADAAECERKLHRYLDAEVEALTQATLSRADYLHRRRVALEEQLLALGGEPRLSIAEIHQWTGGEFSRQFLAPLMPDGSIALRELAGLEGLKVEDRFRLLARWAAQHDPHTLIGWIVNQVDDQEISAEPLNPELASEIADAKRAIIGWWTVGEDSGELELQRGDDALSDYLFMRGLQGGIDEGETAIMAEGAHEWATLLIRCLHEREWGVNHLLYAAAHFAANDQEAAGAGVFLEQLKELAMRLVEGHHLSQSHRQRRV